MGFINRNLLLIVGGLLGFLVGSAYSETVPGTVVAYAQSVYIGSPSMVILPNGDYIASHDTYPGVLQTRIYRSQDKGMTWSYVSHVPDQYESTLFIHNGDLYLIGGYMNVDTGDYYVALSKSVDGGISWTDPDSGLLTSPSTTAYHGAPVPILFHNGRIWRGIDMSDGQGGYYTMVLSAPTDSDLLDSANWTVSNSLLLSDYVANNIWLEGNVVANPDGDLEYILRVGGMTDKAAVLQLSPDGQALSFSPQTFIDLPGGAVKFTIRYDQPSDKYWAVVNKQTDPVAERNRLVLISSLDLVNWTVEKTILENSDPVAIGFQYADWQFEGDDIVFVSRTAFGYSDYFHDAEFLTFHRINNFRLLSASTITIIDAAADTEIDQHVNYNNNNMGSETSMRVEIRSEAYTNPVVSPESWAMIKWDLSSIPSTDIITDVTFQIQQIDSAVGTVDVYGIDQGIWEETTVTWNSWEADTTSETLLGNMANKPITSGTPMGLSMFTADSFAELVQGWHDGSLDNLGIILKWTGDIGQGDAYLTRENTGGYIAPQLVIQHIPATSITTVSGAVELSGYTGGLDNVAASVELSQNGAVVVSMQELLGTDGEFSISMVPVGIYDISIKTFSSAKTVLPNVNISTTAYDLGTVILDSGDLNGDSVINILDFSVMANNWLFAE